MKTIFVMVKCQLGHSYDVAEKAVDQVDQVSEVYSISGRYDLLIKCVLEEGEDIGRFVNRTIQILPGVADTFTLITFKAFR